MTIAPRALALTLSTLMVAACGDGEQRVNPEQRIDPEERVNPESSVNPGPIDEPAVCATSSCIYGSVVFDDSSSMPAKTSADFQGLAGEYFEFVILVTGELQREEPDKLVVNHDEFEPNFQILSPEVLVQYIEPGDGYPLGTLRVRGGPNPTMRWGGARTYIGSVTRTEWGVHCQEPAGIGTDEEGLPELESATCESGTAWAQQEYPGEYFNRLPGRSWWRLVSGSPPR